MFILIALTQYPRSFFVSLNLSLFLSQTILVFLYSLDLSVCSQCLIERVMRRFCFHKTCALRKLIALDCTANMVDLRCYMTFKTIPYLVVDLGILSC